MTTRTTVTSSPIIWRTMTTPTVASCSETAAQSQLDDGPVTLGRVTQFLTLVIECNIVYLILEFSHTKV